MARRAGAAAVTRCEESCAGLTTSCKDVACERARCDSVPRVLLAAHGDKRAIKGRKEPSPHREVATEHRRARAHGVKAACDSLSAWGVARSDDAVPDRAADGAHRERAAEVVEDTMRARIAVHTVPWQVRPCFLTRKGRGRARRCLVDLSSDLLAGWPDQGLSPDCCRLISCAVALSTPGHMRPVRAARVCMLLSLLGRIAPRRVGYMGLWQHYTLSTGAGCTTVHAAPSLTLRSQSHPSEPEEFWNRTERLRARPPRENI